jgi:hypothetical protein
MAAKPDVFREKKDEYAAPREPRLVRVTRGRYLAVTGSGAPASPPFQDAIGALYGVAYTVKMAGKRSGRDFKVAPLEGLWWVDRGPMPPARAEDWRWTLVIRVPDFVGAKDLRAAAATLAERGRGDGARRVKLATLSEGTCVQALHVGPYDAEAPTLEKMEAVARRNGWTFDGKHHEIYLSDPRRVPPARLRTILRHPVKRRTR